MNCYYIAVGDGGVRAAEAMLFSLACGAVDAEEIRFLLIPSTEEAEARFTALCGQYSVLSSRIGRAEGTGAAFSARVRMAVWPEKAQRIPLSKQCRAPEDQWLVDQLFSEQEAAADSLNGYGPAAALNWERLLQEEGESALMEFVRSAEAEGERCFLFVCGAAGEPVSAAGLPRFLPWLRKRLPEADIRMALLLPVSEEEDAPLAKGALPLIAETGVSAALIGLPMDCWVEERGAHFVDWLSAAAFQSMLKGREGPFTYRVPLSDVKWEAFGEEAERWRGAFERMFRFAFLQLTEFAPAAKAMLTRPNWLRDRLVPWYTACFLKKEHLTEDGRAQSAEEIEQAERFLSAYVLWLCEVQQSLPLPLRCSEGLREAREAASAHYALILDKAGEISQLQHDLKQSGMDREDVVHRREEEESDAEKAVRQLHELREELLALYQAQEKLNLRLGGRMQRMMLDEALQHCKQEAEEARGQLRYAAERIEEASRFANQKDGALLAAAQSRMEQLEHHLIAMDGRTECAQRDARAALAPDISSRPPLEEEAQTGSLLFDSDQLDYLQRVIQAGGREIRLLRQSAGEHWPFERLTPEGAQSRLGQLAGHVAAEHPVTAFFTAVYQLAGSEDD